MVRNSIIYNPETNLFSSQNLSISQAKWLSISPGLMLVPQTGQHGAWLEDDLCLPEVDKKKREKCVINLVKRKEEIEKRR